MIFFKYDIFESRQSIVFLESCRYTIERSVRRDYMGRHMSPRKLPLSWGLDQLVGSAKTAEPIKMPFRGLTHAGSRNNVLVGWAHWRNVVNAIESSTESAKRQHRVQVRQLVHMQRRLSLSAADALEYHIKFTHKISPAMRPFIY